MPNRLAAHNGISGRDCLAQRTLYGEVFGAMSSPDKPPASTNVPGESPAALSPDLGEIALVMGGGGAGGGVEVLIRLVCCATSRAGIRISTSRF
jgi:hypothetical protein